MNWTLSDSVFKSQEIDDRSTFALKRRYKTKEREAGNLDTKKASKTHVKISHTTVSYLTFTDSKVKLQQLSVETGNCRGQR